MDNGTAAGTTLFPFWRFQNSTAACALPACRKCGRLEHGTAACIPLVPWLFQYVEPDVSKWRVIDRDDNDD